MLTDRMYLIKTVPADAKLLEMCFDCSAFQYQLDKDKPLKDHVFQTIFLNKRDEHTWTRDEIQKDKISQSRRSALHAPRWTDPQSGRIGGTSSATRGNTTPLSSPSSGH